MKRDVINITKSLIPYHFSIALPTDIYTLSIRYNKTANLFTVGLYRDNTLICVEPIIYGTPLFEQLYQPGIYPSIKIVPFDYSRENTAITWDNLNETVFLYVDNASGEFEV